MHCIGTGAIERVLTRAKTKGTYCTAIIRKPNGANVYNKPFAELINHFTVNLDTQNVAVSSNTASFDEVKDIISKTGKGKHSLISSPLLNGPLRIIAVNIGKNGDQPAIAYTPEGRTRLAEKKSSITS